MDRLVHEGLPIVEAVARRMEHKLGHVLARDELLAIARPALLDAARGYDPARAPFHPYLVMKVKWAMLDEARKVRRHRRIAARASACAAVERLSDEDARVPHETLPLRSEAEYQADLSRLLAQRAAALAVGLVSLSDAGDAEDHESPEERFAREELRRDVRGAVETLPEKQRALVLRHYFGGENFDVIAADLGVSKSWASRLHAQAMDALAAVLRGRT